MLMKDLLSNMIVPLLFPVIVLLWVRQRPDRKTEQSLEGINSIITAIVQVPGNDAQFGENGS